MRIVALVLLLVLTVVFSLQNTEVVTLSLLWWQVRASLAVIMALCVSIGLLVGLALLAPLLYRRRSSNRQLEQRLAAMEAEKSARNAGSSSVPVHDARMDNR